MKLIIHQNYHIIADFSEIFSYLKSSYKKSDAPRLHLFPELFLTGYPLQDLCLQDSFIEKYLLMLEKINHWSQNLPSDENTCFLLGGLQYDHYDKNQQNYQIRNVIYKLIPGKKLQAIYTKQLLPNYDIFDERKYYWTGKETGILKWQNKTIGLLICEDMWPSTFYHHDPAKLLFDKLKTNQTSPDLIINLSASPFALGKKESRKKRALFLSQKFQCPFAYVNRVGGEDEILFDGSSFVIDDQNKKITELESFKNQCLEVEIPQVKKQSLKNYHSETQHVWQNLFKPRLNFQSTPPKLIPLTDQELHETLEALKFSLKEYSSKNGFNKFLIALSGGLDSSLVLAITRMALSEKQSVEAVYMPSQFSSSLSYELSFQLCQNLGVKFTSLPIKFLHSTCKNLFTQHFSEPLTGTSDENIQSRLRGTLLYARSNQTNAMVINTSNKSEIAVGYSTQYGDSVGAISLLGDLYKSEVYQLAHYINKKFSNIIPEKIITRPPTAELRHDQVDSDSLPKYQILDALLEGILSYQYSKTELLNLGFQKDHLEKVFHLYRISEFKRYQFCPISKIKMKSFGFGYRLPISKSRDIY